MIEGVLLTGGASSRMGVDKSQMVVNGIPMEQRILRALSEACDRVTVLGLRPIEGYAFVADAVEYQGPLVALSAHQPVSEFVFVASCDLPLFDATVVRALCESIGDRDACIPFLNGRAQPLCALYRKSSWATLSDLVSAGERRVMAWIRELSVTEFDSADLPVPRAVANANTPEDLARLLQAL